MDSLSAVPILEWQSKAPPRLEEAPERGAEATEIDITDKGPETTQANDSTDWLHSYNYLRHVAEARNWLETHLGSGQPPFEESLLAFEDQLQSGVALAHLVNTMSPSKFQVYDVGAPQLSLCTVVYHLQLGTRTELEAHGQYQPFPCVRQKCGGGRSKRFSPSRLFF